MFDFLNNINTWCKRRKNNFLNIEERGLDGNGDEKGQSDDGDDDAEIGRQLTVESVVHKFAIGGIEYVKISEMNEIDAITESTQW